MAMKQSIGVIDVERGVALVALEGSQTEARIVVPIGGLCVAIMAAGSALPFANAQWLQSPV